MAYGIDCSFLEDYRKADFGKRMELVCKIIGNSMAITACMAEDNLGGESKKKILVIWVKTIFDDIMLQEDKSC